MTKPFEERFGAAVSTTDGTIAIAKCIGFEDVKGDEESDEIDRIFLITLAFPASGRFTTRRVWESALLRQPEAAMYRRVYDDFVEREAARSEQGTSWVSALWEAAGIVPRVLGYVLLGRER